MTRAETIAAVRASVARARASGRRIALVPTMGYLHEGHLSLVDRARELADYVVVSVFVNPLQFGPGEDFDEYPRDAARDAAMLETRGADVMFAPSAEALYPRGEPGVSVVPGALADRLCGAFRPGHFQGVLTVVAKLLNIVRPDAAVFGRKDFQQGVLIGRMVRDLDWDVSIELAPIVREPDGLAMSSRNVYLSAAQRDQALSLSRGLFAAKAAFEAGERDADRLCARAEETLTAAGVQPQYVELVEPEWLEPVARAVQGNVLAVAAYIGPTRLIDNVVLE